MRSLLLVLVLAPFITTACARAQTPTDGTRPQTIPEGATELTVETVEEIANRFYSGIADRRREVIRTPEDWHALWTELTILQVPQPDPPVIDFDRQMVVVATMGRQSTGGYLITIPTVHEHEGKLFVEVVEVSPGPGCLTTQALTAPTAAIKIEAREDPVTFVDRSEQQSCQ
jgi:hypothetical protein